MKNKTLLSISILCLVSLAVFVFADISDDYQINPEGIESSVTLEKGWNLVSIYAFNRVFRNLEVSDTQELSSMGIKATFFYDRYSGEYVRLYPQQEVSKLSNFFSRLGDPEEAGDIKEYGAFTNSAMWVYTDKSQTLNFRTNDGPLYVKYVNLRQGWNFLLITPDMSGETFKSIKGNCQIEQVASWNERSQTWMVQPYSEVENDGFTSFINEIRLFKLSSDCNFEAGEKVITTPPAIPK